MEDVVTSKAKRESAGEVCRAAGGRTRKLDDRQRHAIAAEHCASEAIVREVQAALEPRTSSDW